MLVYLPSTPTPHHKSTISKVAKVQHPHPRYPHHCRPNQFHSESNHRFCYGVNTIQRFLQRHRISDLEACELWRFGEPQLLCALTISLVAEVSV
ncbi:hypothetical protein R6Q59_029125 [Mikania micrantha]